MVDEMNSRELQRPDDGNPSTDDKSLQEASISVTFSGIMLASAAFLLTLAFTSRTLLSRDILLYLLAAFLFLTTSLHAYGNASGHVARLGGKRFSRYMVIGNIMTEFGGFYPLMYIIPIALAEQYLDIGLGLIACAISAAALLLYHLSGISLLGRYTRKSAILRVVSSAYFSLAPIIGGLAFYLSRREAAWAALNASLLTIMALYSALVGEHTAKQ